MKNFLVGLFWLAVAIAFVLFVILIIINLPALIIMAAPFVIAALGLALFIVVCFYLGKLIRRFV